MSKHDYSPELIAECVRDTFSTAQGQVTLEWLTDLYVKHKSLHLVQSGSPNLEGILCYQAGKKDVVLEIIDVLERGFEDDQEPNPNQEELP